MGKETTAATILKRLRRAGLSLRLSDDGILAGPKGLLTEKRKQVIASNREAIIAELTAEYERVQFGAGAGFSVIGLTDTEEEDLRHLTEWAINALHEMPTELSPGVEISDPERSLQQLRAEIGALHRIRGQNRRAFLARLRVLKEHCS